MISGRISDCVCSANQPPMLSSNLNSRVNVKFRLNQKCWVKTQLVNSSLGRKLSQIYHPCDVKKFCEHGLLISKSENFIGSKNYHMVLYSSYKVSLLEEKEIKWNRNFREAISVSISWPKNISLSFYPKIIRR